MSDFNKMQDKKYFLDTTGGAVADTYAWAYVGKSTKADKSANPTTKSYTFTNGSNETNVISYDPEVKFEQPKIQSEEISDLISLLMRTYPTGSDVNYPMLEIDHKIELTDTTYPAVLYPEAAIMIDSDSLTDNNLPFSVKTNGTGTVGTVTFTNGVPTFVAGDES